MSKHHVTVLRKARSHIKAGRTNLICCAIAAAVRGVEPFSEKSRAAAELRYVICTRLRPHTTYDDWMWFKHKGLYAQAMAKGTVSDELRRGRLAWIDALIEEFKDKP